MWSELTGRTSLVIHSPEGLESRRRLGFNLTVQSTKTIQKDLIGTQTFNDTFKTEKVTIMSETRQFLVPLGMKNGSMPKLPSVETTVGVSLLP